MNDVISNNHILKDTADYSFGSFCITSFSDPTNPQNQESVIIVRFWETAHLPFP